MSQTKDQKAEARRAAFARRKAAHAALAPQEAGARAADTLVGLASGGPEGRIVAGYMPIRTEIDPGPAMAALHAQGLRLCLPVIEGAGLPLRFRAWAPGEALAEGPFGARIPAAGDWLTPELIIVPLVAFDAEGFRLGYGGGFYDRTLARLRAQGPCRAIGLAYAAQEAATLPREPTDEPLDALVTEAGLRFPAPSLDAPHLARTRPGG